MCTCLGSRPSCCVARKPHSRVLSASRVCGARPLTASRLSWPRLRRSRPARIGVTAAAQGVGSGSGSGAPLGTAWILPHIGTRIIGHNLDWKQGVNAGCCGSASSARSWRPLTTSGLLDFFAPHCFGGGVEVTEAHEALCPACAQGRCGQRTLSGPREINAVWATEIAEVP